MAEPWCRICSCSVAGSQSTAALKLCASSCIAGAPCDRLRLRTWIPALCLAKLPPGTQSPCTWGCQFSSGAPLGPPLHHQHILSLWQQPHTNPRRVVSHSPWLPVPLCLGRPTWGELVHDIPWHSHLDPTTHATWGHHGHARSALYLWGHRGCASPTLCPMGTSWPCAVPIATLWPCQLCRMGTWWPCQMFPVPQGH